VAEFGPLRWLSPHTQTNSQPPDEMPQPHSLEPLEIQLESSELVFRGFTGEELEPAVLKGEVVLNLAEPTNLKEIQ